MKPIDKFTKIIQLILNSPGITQRLLNKASGFDPSSVCRILQDAIRLEYIEKNGTNYFPGPIFQKYLQKSIEIE